MADKYNSGTNADIQTAMSAITTALGIEMDFTDSPGFELKIAVTPDGQSITVQGTPSGAGQSNPFGAEVGGRNPRVPPLQIPAEDLP